MWLSRMVILSLAIVVFLTGCTSSNRSSGIPKQGIPQIQAKRVSYQDIPHGAIHQRAKSFRPEPPDHFSKPGKIKILFWFQAATYQPIKQTTPAHISVDYMEVIKVNHGQEKIIFREDYAGAKRRFDIHEGGLFTRLPRWFANNNNQKIRDSWVQNGLLSLKIPSNKIVHWWTPRLPYQKGAHYFVRIRVKITGVGFQIGSDFWNGDKTHNGWDQDCWKKNNCELGVSGWYGDTKGQFVIIMVPI